MFHDDLGSQKNAFFSPELFRKLLLPHYQKLTKAAHDAGMYVTLHSAGNVGVQIRNFIDAGFDAWDGQDGVDDKQAIMAAHGDRLAQTDNFIIAADVSDEEAVDMIHERVETLGAKGRYACRLHVYGENRKLDLADELYRISREYYAKSK